MRKFVVLPLLLCWIPFLANTQTYLGLSGGGGFPAEVAFRGGLQMERQVSEVLYLRGALAFLQIENPDVVALLPRDKQYLQAVISYLEFPLQVKLQLDMDVFSIYGLLGPQVAYGTGLNTTFRLDNRYFGESLRVRDWLRGWDLGLVSGMGVEKTISEGKKIFVEFRYQIGLLNISRQASREAFNQGKAVNIGFAVPLGNKKG